MTQLSIVSKLKIEDDFAWTMRLCTEVQASREVLEMATIRFVRRTKGSLAERIRMASELSGIPRGVIEELVKDAAMPLDEERGRGPLRWRPPANRSF